MTSRKAAAIALDRVMNQGGFSNLVWREAPADVPERDRPFATALFYGVLERAYTLDFVLSRYLTQPPSKLDSTVRIVLLIGLYQLLYMKLPKHAAVSETVALCGTLGRTRQAGFVNGVLRAFLRDNCAIPSPADPVQRLAVDFSCPPALVRGFLDDYGEQDARRILEGSLTTAPLTLRVNTRKTSTDVLEARLRDAGFSPERIPGLPDALNVRGEVPSMPGYTDGCFHVEDAAAQLAALLTDARPGQTVVDVCAAPGGKSFVMAEQMNDEGALYAFDAAPQRVRLISDGASRLGLGCIRAVSRDGRNPDEALAGKADRVLCDLPCSGLGVLRRKPELKRKPVPAGLDVLQRALLEASAAYVAPGGMLVYSTCTLRKAENDQIAGWFLREHPEFEPLALPELPEFPTLRGAEHTATFLPGATDGFFIARFARLHE